VKGHHRPFLTLWVLAVGAAVLAFVVHLAMRGRTVALAYDLGKARAEQARLREVRRVLELEVASYQTPQRVEMVARSVLRMTPPSADRILAMTTPGAAAPTDPATPLPKASAAPPRGAAAPRGSASSREAAAPAPTELLLPRITPPKPAQALSANPQAEVSPE
jgi:cell division protein FtsL